MKQFYIILTITMFLGCSDANFEGDNGRTQKEPEEVSTADQSAQTEPSESLPADPNVVKASPSIKPVPSPTGKTGPQREMLKLGGVDSSDAIDYLFVVDSSVSMRAMLTSINKGFQALGNSSKFTPGARAAVMTMLTGNPNDLSAVHPWVLRQNNVYPEMAMEPGFLSLVDEAQIAAFKLAVPSLARVFPLKGCDAWFVPNATNSDGKLCFSAHTQLTYKAIGIEPGGTVLKQLMQKRGSQATFRKGALVNIIFVSDTHESGHEAPPADVKVKPTAEQLIAAIKEHNEVVGVKFHAIAPARKCFNEDIYDKYYYKLVDATGGVKVDACRVTDYTKVLEDVATSGLSVENPVFSLKGKIKRILKVTIDGVETSAFLWDKAKNTLTLFGNISLADEKNVSIEFESE